MAHPAIIYSVDINQYAEPMTTPIDIRVVLTNLHTTEIIHDNGIIPDLARKYQFEVISDTHLDLTSMLKRDCIVDYDKDDRPYFVRYV